MNARRLLVVALSAVLVVAFKDGVGACPGGFCCTYKTSLADQLAQAEVVVLAKQINANEQAKQTSFVIQQFLRGKSEELNVGDVVIVQRVLKEDRSGLHLLLGNEEQPGVLAWGSLGAMSETALAYMLAAPSPELARSQRLPYFLRFLESSDPTIAEDAFLELNSAVWTDYLACLPQLPRDKLREWLRNTETNPARLGLYAQLLGICGNKSDADFLLSHIRQPTDDFRLGIEGYSIGYLWRTGEKGLAVLEEVRLCRKELPFSERYAVMQAIRFMVAHGEDRISRERACESLRLLLEEPELADLVINDLARWKDWSVQDRVMSLYGQGAYDNRSIKRAIVRYLLNAERALPPKAVLQVQVNLEILREKDPKTVKEAERFFFLQ